MTVATVPYVEQNLSHSAALFRQAFAAGWTTGGICAPGELAVAAQASPNMTVQVAAGRAIVPGTNVTPPSGFGFTTQGDYFVLNDGTISVTISAANATNPRIDVVYVGVQDQFYSGSTNTALIGVVTGTPAPSPTVPAIPTNAIALANVAVAANATSIVTANITAATVRALANGATRLLGEVYVPQASQTLLGTVMTDVTGATVTANATGGLIRVSVSGGLMNAGSGGNRSAQVQILCDGALIGEAFPNSGQLYVGWISGNNTTPFTHKARHTPAAGSHTWKLQGLASASSALYCTQPTFTVEELAQ